MISRTRVPLGVLCSCGTGGEKWADGRVMSDDAPSRTTVFKRGRLALSFGSLLIHTTAYSSVLILSFVSPGYISL